MERRTSKPEFYQFIVDSLRIMGSGTEDEVLESVYKLIQSRLHSADLVVLPNGVPRWRNQALHMIDGLIEDGVIIKKEGKLWLSEKKRL